MYPHGAQTSSTEFVGDTRAAASPIASAVWPMPPRPIEGSSRNRGDPRWTFIKLRRPYTFTLASRRRVAG